MGTIDILIISAYFALSIGFALLLTRKAGKNMEEFFLSGRKLPWWIAGTTMVATTFAADTPLAVTELVARHGIAGNWLWWNMLAGNILTVFFFAKLWRRANIITDVEFIELRYSGSSASFLRGFKVLYLGIFMNVIIMGWVNVALAEILRHILGIHESYLLLIIIGSMILVGVYSALAGLWGIALTDMFQFVIAMAGCIILAIVVLNLPEVGGIEGLQAKLPEHLFSFTPSISFSGTAAAAGILSLSFSAFVAHIAVQWWASWYPGAEPGGGGYIAQRMMSAKDERHSLLATLWFTIAHYALRPWPWILVALAALVLYPDLAADEKKTGFVLAMRDHLPTGLLGLLVAAFLAAYMSTISTHLNWGTSYIINDFYKRFIKQDGNERHYVLISRVTTGILVILASLLVLVIKSISGAWAFIIECGAGLGTVLILRWYWWRINAWSEITAMIAPFIGYGVCRFVFNIVFPQSLFVIVLFTTVAWLSATFITQPVDEKTLNDFYRRTTPGGPGWKRFSAKHNKTDDMPLSHLFFNWLAGIIMVYCSLFAIGKLIFREYAAGLVLTVLSVTLFIFIAARLKKAS